MNWQETVLKVISVSTSLNQEDCFTERDGTLHIHTQKELTAGLERQAEASFKAGVKRVEQSLAPHYEEDSDGIYRQNGWWLPDDIWQSIKNGG